MCDSNSKTVTGEEEEEEKEKMCCFGREFCIPTTSHPTVVVLFSLRMMKLRLGLLPCIALPCLALL